MDIQQFPSLTELQRKRQMDMLSLIPTDDLTKLYAPDMTVANPPVEDVPPEGAVVMPKVPISVATPVSQYQPIPQKKSSLAEKIESRQEDKSGSKSESGYEKRTGLRESKPMSLYDLPPEYQAEYEQSRKLAEDARKQYEIQKAAATPQLDLSPLMALADIENKGRTSWYSQYKRPEDESKSLIKYYEDMQKAQREPANVLLKAGALAKQVADIGEKSTRGNTINTGQGLTITLGNQAKEDTGANLGKAPNLHKLIASEKDFIKTSGEMLRNIDFVDKTLPAMRTNPVIAKSNILKFAKASQGSGKLDNYTEEKFEEIDPTLFEVGRQIYDKNFNGEVINDHNYQLYVKAMEIIAQAQKKRIQDEIDNKSYALEAEGEWQIPQKLIKDTLSYRVGMGGPKMPAKPKEVVKEAPKKSLEERIKEAEEKIKNGK